MSDGNERDVVSEYDGTADLEGDGGVALAKPEAEEVPTSDNPTISVTCGANSQLFGDISGRTISEVRRDLGDVMNISDNAAAMVSGAAVSEDYVVQPGDRLEFIQASGTKG